MWFLCLFQQWNDELAFLAEMNVRSCNYGHDKCRATGNIMMNCVVTMVFLFWNQSFFDLFSKKWIFMWNLSSNWKISEKFPWAGQNIARRGNTKGYENTKSAIKHMINDWFIEYKDANMGIINSYHNHPLG